MGGVPRKHDSKSKVGKRRSQQALKKARFLVCKNCGGPVMPHRTCLQCGSKKSKAQNPKS